MFVAIASVIRKVHDRFSFIKWDSERSPMNAIRVILGPLPEIHTAARAKSCRAHAPAKIVEDAKGGLRGWRCDTMQQPVRSLAPLGVHEAGCTAQLQAPARLLYDTK